MQTACHAQITVSGDWAITVPQGTYTVDGQRHKVAQTQIIDVTPQPLATTVNEKANIPADGGANAAPWARGYNPAKLIPGGIGAPYALRQSRVYVKGAKDATIMYTRGKDFEIDPIWGALWRTADSRIPTNNTCYITYTYGLCRLDSVVVDRSGTVRLVLGKPGVWEVAPPATPAGCTLIGRIWMHGNMKKLENEQVYNVTATHMSAHAGAPLAAQYTPKVLKKLQDGQSVSILFWGDSVTAGGNATEGMGFQHQFIKMLKEAYPKANIQYTTCAWGGRTTHAFLSEPSGSEYNFMEKIVAPKPDLVVSEFVNDMGLPMDMLTQDHEFIKKIFAENNIEWLIMTPHLTTFDVLGGNSWRFAKDPRQPVHFLRQFAQPGIGVADAAARYEHFDSEGIPFASFMVNCINHPNNWGHHVFAESLLSYFTGK